MHLTAVAMRQLLARNIAAPLIRVMCRAAPCT